MHKRVQTEPDVLFGNFQGRSQSLRAVPRQAFAQAHATLSLTAFVSLNYWLVTLTGHHGIVLR